MCFKRKKTKNNTKQQKTKKTKSQTTSLLKQKYFEFYDDIKDYTNGKEDW